MRLNKNIKNWVYRSLSLLVAVSIVVNSFSFDRAASAHNPPPTANSAKIDRLASTNGGHFCANNLKPVLDSIVKDPIFDGAEWGVMVQSLRSGQPLYQYNAELDLIPASNMKLLTTAAAVRSVPNVPDTDMEEWLHSISLANRDSNNQQANLLLSRVGGVGAIKSAITPLGVNPNTYEQIDGSGLSRDNRAEAITFVNLLKGISRIPENKIFYDSLSISGTNGTLRNRLIDPLVRGRVHAKTGTLTGVRSLSGYLENPHYGTMVFSVILNQPGQSGSVMTDAIDRMIFDLAQVRNCG
jgi:serine-type D-Ala-D-Ala carboxypeptidase/endopeptidase (penicillin-binding protein 4)